MKEICHEIVHDSELGICGVGIALGYQKSGFETMIGFAFLTHKVPVFEEPVLRFLRNLFPMPVTAKFEGTV